MDSQKGIGKIKGFKDLLEKLKGPLFVKILLAAGLAGILLIFLSEFIWPSGGGKKQASTSSQAGTSADTYEKKVESQLQSIIGQIEGVGKVRVMVTLQSGVENVFEQDDKTTADKSQDSQKDGSVQTQDNSNSEQNPVVIQNGDGGQQALIKTQVQPKIQGVVVVCSGGNNADVCLNVVDTISTALGIPSNHISVSQMAEAEK